MVESQDVVAAVVVAESDDWVVRLGELVVVLVVSAWIQTGMNLADAAADLTGMIAAVAAWAFAVVVHFVVAAVAAAAAAAYLDAVVAEPQVGSASDGPVVDQFEPTAGLPPGG
ncbi:MAG: hypothetical protein K0Q77_1750 [Anaerosporomusa subterranea]|nr:hypothetical protein [Anaerosporomusa subterranea]